MSEFLKALPVVATSPMALVGYLAVVATMVAIRFRVARNKQLLANLEKLPEADRLAALRAEMGDLPIPPGYSARDWLTARNQRYRFWGVAMVCVLVAVLAAMAFAARPKPGTADFDLTPYSGPGPGEVAIVNAYDGTGQKDSWFNEDFKARPELTLNYTYTREGDRIRVSPDMPYLKLLADGGPITDIAPFNWQFPKLSVENVNNTDKTLLLTEAVIEVRSSAVVTEPVIKLGEGGGMEFANEGWGAVLEPVVQFATSALRDDCTPSSWPDQYPYEARPDFAATANVQIDKNGPYVSDELRSGDGVCFQGVLRYRTEAGTQRAVKFFGNHVFEGGLGGGEEPSYLYDIYLKAGVTGRMHIPISQSVTAAGVDHFLFRIATDKSATYDMRVSLRDAGGAEIVAADVNLETFVPRSESERRERRATVRTNDPRTP